MHHWHPLLSAVLPIRYSFMYTFVVSIICTIYGDINMLISDEGVRNGQILVREFV